MLLFLSLEKKTGQNRLIHCLRSVDGRDRTEANEIRKRAVELFSRLYTCEYRGFTVVREEQHGLTDLGCPLTVQGLQVALLSMEKDKAPGTTVYL